MGRFGVKPETDFIIDWLGRMARKYPMRQGVGSVNYNYDWGQALCVEQYGKDNADWPDDPSPEDVEVAKKWEAGEFPSWIWSPHHKGSEREV